MSQTRLLIEAVDALDAAGVGYLLTGSFASSLQGEPRATHDIDLVIEVDPNVVEALAAAFSAPAYYLDNQAAFEALRTRSMFNLLDTTSGDKIDFWALTEDPFDASRFIRRVRIDALGRALSVSSPEDTILQKLRWAKASGGSVRHARDAQGVYELQAGTLDERYLDQWADRLGVSDLLAQVRERADIDSEQV